MGRDLYDNFPVARALFDEADEALGFALSKLIFEGPEEQLKLTEHTQPAILTCSRASSHGRGKDSCFRSGMAATEWMLSMWKTPQTLTSWPPRRSSRNW